MNQELIIRKLKKRLLIERIASGTILLLLFITWMISSHVSSKTFIMVDGKPLVCVHNAKEANSILESIKSKNSKNPGDVKFKQDICMARAPRDASPVSRFKAMRVLERAVSPVVYKLAIIANGEPVVAVPDKETAAKTLELAKIRFGSKVNQLLEEPQIREKTEIDTAPVSPSMYKRTAEEAVEYLFSKRASVKSNAVYVVKKGDIAGSIAESHSLKLAELWNMNPGKNLNRLSIGDHVNVKAAAKCKAKLTVVVRDQEYKTEKTPPPVLKVSSARLYIGQSTAISPGKPGVRKVKIANIYENGQKVGSEIIEEEVISDPIPKQVAVGIKPKPTW